MIEHIKKVCSQCFTPFMVDSKLNKVNPNSICPICESIKDSIEEGTPVVNPQEYSYHREIQELLSLVFENSHGLLFEIFLFTLKDIKEKHPEVNIQESLSFGFNEWVK